jgi:signal transduction histidine kinase
LFDWTPAEKVTESAEFLRREVVPHREAVMTMTAEMEELNNVNHEDQRAEVKRQQAALRSDLQRLLWQTLLLGLAGAVIAVVRLRVLERRSEQQRETTAEAERQMRRLSQQIVATQEEERKKLSRELHDHVGQMLTALRMELGRIERLRAPTNTPVAQAVLESRQIVDNIVRIVRDLSLGLRPSMLDDFGLQAAVEWHVRDFSRRFALPVDLTVRGDLDGLPDQYRTCVYRAVQEALTNCVRHSNARRIEVALLGQTENLHITIKDDGVGIEAGRIRVGLGLRGIEERVKELGGTMDISSEPGAGTTLAIVLPLPDRVSEVPLARAAG